MKRLLVFAVATVAATSLLLAGRTPETPAATPSKVPAAPTQAAEPANPAEPTKVAAAQPSPAPVRQVDFPAKGKTITVIIPYPAGGGTDTAARFIMPMLEKELGTSIQILNRPGASAQLGLTQLARSKPDGYTIGYTNMPTAITTYLDPERKAVFGRKDFQPVATEYDVPYLVAVQASSPYKTLDDLINAAKANPEKIRAGTTGLLAIGHLALLKLEKAAGVKFAPVHFDGSAPVTVALLGGHVDVVFNPEVYPHFKSGQVRVLGVMAKDESKFFPGAKTLESQGYKIYADSMAGISAPAGVSREIVDILSAAFKKVVETDEHKKKMEEIGFDAYYLNAEQYGKYWDESEAELIPLIAQARQQ